MRALDLKGLDSPGQAGDLWSRRSQPGFQGVSCFSDKSTLHAASLLMGRYHTRLCGNIKTKSHVQSTRHLVFLLIDALLAKQLGAMKTLGDELVSGYIKLAEGEKDPRNLMLAFGIGRVILIEFDPYKHLDVSISINRENDAVFAY